MEITKRPLQTCFLLSFFSLVISPLFSQEKLFFENVEKRMIDELTQFQQHHKLTSLSFSIFWGTENAFDYALGYADVENKIPATPDHIYTLASVTKPITGAVVIDLVHQNYFSLTDSVYKYIPGFPKNVTVLDLLNHTSGFLREKENEKFLQNSDYRAVVTYLPRQFKRKIHRYANFNYAVLGALIEKVTGRTFAQVAQDYFYKSTQERLYFANHHGTNGSARFVKNYVRRYRRQYQHTPLDFGLWEPAALAQTSARALAKFLRHHITTEFIDYLAQHAAVVKRFKDKTGHLIKDCYALGFRLRYVDDELLYIYHDGFIYGVLSTLFYFPRKDVGFVALSNMSYFPRNSVTLSEFAEVVEKIIDEEFHQDLAEYTATHGHLQGAIYYETKKYRGQLSETRLMEYAQKFFDEKRYNEAINLYKFTSDKFPNSPATYENLGKAYLAAGQPELAIETLKKGLQINPSSETAKELLRKLSAN